MMSALFVSHWPLYRFSGSRRRAALGLGAPLLRHGPPATALYCTQQQSKAKGAQAVRPYVSSECSSTQYRTRNGNVTTLATRAPPKAVGIPRTQTQPKDVVPRGPPAPTKMTSVMATRAKNHASLALPLPCNAVYEASKLSPMTTATCRSNFMLRPLHPSNQEWPLS